MAKRAQTMELSGNAYAKVAERLRLFREEWKNGKIETEHKYNDDGTVEFKAWIWKDKQVYLNMLVETKDTKLARGSADADGNSKGNITDKKAFEKLQTIAVGRALANLGYLASGDIASFEEMEEFDTYKREQHARAVQSAVEAIEGASSIDDLMQVFKELKDFWNEPDVIKAKDARKAELTPKQEEPPKRTAGKVTSETQTTLESEDENS